MAALENEHTGRPVRAKGLHGRWLSFSLRQKFRFLTGMVAAAVVLAVSVSLLVSGFGALEFGHILDNTSKSLGFWSAMESESRLFTTYVREPSAENEEAYHRACQNTERALEALPFDYRTVGAGRYAKTWSIRNSYETYRAERDRLLSMEAQDEQFVETLYRVYRMQEYIKSYAGSLEQMNVEEGNLRYGRQKPVFYLIPAAAVFLGVLAGAVIVWMRRSVDRDFITPVLRMAEASREISAGNFDGCDVTAESGDEIGELVRAFCGMKKATKGYIVTLKEKHMMERQLDDVRLQMLKNQINPHFLFNTLNMIAGAAQMEEAETTERMITAMSRLFRYNLKSTESVMPLGRELKVVEDYMYLQSMRFGERLRCSTDCKPETLEILVPSFALQPLVENAIVHGISGRVEGGRIHIRSWLRDGRLWISVADTGNGIGNEKLEAIRRAMELGEEGAVGVGVGNICRRIRALYSDGEVFLYSRENFGTVVQLAFTAGI